MCQGVCCLCSENRGIETQVVRFSCLSVACILLWTCLGKHSHSVQWMNHSFSVPERDRRHLRTCTGSVNGNTGSVGEQGTCVVISEVIHMCEDASISEKERQNSRCETQRSGEKQNKRSLLSSEKRQRKVSPGLMSRLAVSLYVVGMVRLLSDARAARAAACTPTTPSPPRPRAGLRPPLAIVVVVVVVLVVRRVRCDGAAQ